jgi:hypothetical protein
MTVKLAQTAGAAAAIARNLLLGGNLAALRLIGRPRRLMLYISENVSFCRALAGGRGLPQRNVFDVLPAADVESVQFGSLHTGGVWFDALSTHTVDAISLSLICQIMKPKLVFEIGTLTGYTAYQFALNTDADARILTLDLPRDETVRPIRRTTVTDDQHIRVHARLSGYCFDGSSVAAKIVCLHGDSAAFDFSPYHGRVDFFFIDGAHSYDYVRSDTRNALQCCHAGSVIAWHDFGRIGVNGVSRWLIELSSRYEIFSVPGGSLAFTRLE